MACLTQNFAQIHCVHQPCDPSTLAVLGSWQLLRRRLRLVGLRLLPRVLLRELLELLALGVHLGSEGEEGRGLTIREDSDCLALT